jgi:hypothetical protein
MGYFGRALLYGSLVCLLNTLFFVPVPQSPRQAAAGAPVKNAPADDPDNSLLELVMENCFEAPESSPDTPDDVDDLLKKVEYVVQPFAWRPADPVSGELPPKRLTRIGCIAPSLRVPFPPPERLV